MRTELVDGWTIDIGPDTVAAQHPQGGTLVFFVNGRVLSGGCDVPPNVVEAMRAELARLASGETPHR